MPVNTGEQSVNKDTDTRRLVLALFINSALTVVQLVGGIVSGSLALIADAVHNLSDAGSLFIALIARKWSRKPADENRTFGYKRAELIGAMINLTALIMIGLYLLFEAISRVFSPLDIEGWTVVIIAAVALVVDVVTALLTWSMAKNSINLRAAFLHNLVDALASVAVIIAGTLILLYEWYMADIICTVIIAVYVLYHGYAELQSVIRILMQSTPVDIDVNELITALQSIDNVRAVHHLHIWEMDEYQRALEAHVVIHEHDHAKAESTKKRIKSVLDEAFQIKHSTIEFEYDDNSGDTLCNDHRVITSH